MNPRRLIRLTPDGVRPPAGVDGGGAPPVFNAPRAADISASGWRRGVRAATVGLSHNSAAAVCAADDSTRRTSRFSPNEASRSESEFSFPAGRTTTTTTTKSAPKSGRRPIPAPIRASCTAAADANRRMARRLRPVAIDVRSPGRAVDHPSENVGDLSLGAARVNVGDVHHPRGGTRGRGLRSYHPRLPSKMGCPRPG